MRTERNPLPAGEDHSPPDLLVADLHRTVPADQDRSRSPGTRETRDRLPFPARPGKVRLGSAHPVHEAEPCRGARVRGPVNAEMSAVFHHPAFNGVFILFVRAKGGTVGSVERFDSDEGAARVRFGDGHVGGAGRIGAISSATYGSAAESAAAPPTTGSVSHVPDSSTDSSVPGVGCTVKFWSLEMIIRPILAPAGIT